MNKVPLWIKALSALKTPEDSGPGDTFKRLTDPLGGEQIKELMNDVGLPCLCDFRQAEWNKKWNYQNSNNK